VVAGRPPFNLPLELVEELLGVGADLGAGATPYHRLDFLPVLSEHFEA